MRNVCFLPDSLLLSVQGLCWSTAAGRAGGRRAARAIRSIAGISEGQRDQASPVA